VIDHENYKGMLQAHALGALEEDEGVSLDAHLAGCAACLIELGEWRDTAALLAYAAAGVEPRPSLRLKILDNVRASGEKTDIKNLGATRAEEPCPPVSNVVPFERPVQSPRFSRTLKTLAAIAASIAFIGLLISLSVLLQRNRELRAELTKQKSLAPTTALISNPVCQVIELSGTNAAPGAHARLIYDRKTGEAMVFVSGLPQPPPDKAFELWFIAGGKPPVPGPVFRGDQSGEAVVPAKVAAGARDASVFAVTLEPKNGVAAPTGDKYLLGSAL
jgi:hypothetical protein